tara:strand:- start:1510 stop:1998 length:489 start_codon:yes stop_codon:yes gene_type:complete
MNINTQLNIPLVNAKTNYRSAQLQGKHTPYTGSTDWDMDTYNLEDVQDPSWYNQVVNKDGSEWSNFYPTCFKADCKECKAECKSTTTTWKKGGKDCYWKCRDKRNNEIETSIPINLPSNPAQTPVPTKNAKLSQNTKIGIVLGSVLVIGIVGFVVLKKKGKI